jgi:hypothetical protein
MSGKFNLKSYGPLFIPLAISVGGLLYGTSLLTNSSVDSEVASVRVADASWNTMLVLIPLTVALLALVIRQNGIHFWGYVALLLVPSVPNGIFQVSTSTSSLPCLVGWIPGIRAMIHSGGPSIHVSYVVLSSTDVLLFVALYLIVALLTYSATRRGAILAGSAGLAISLGLLLLVRVATQRALC